MNRCDALLALRTQIASELEAVERVAAAARAEATGEETKQEGKYDTRATEASYLARGQAWRIADLRRLKAWFDRQDPDEARPNRVAVGSLVRVAGHREGWLFVAPTGGPQAMVAGEPVRVISPEGPLGHALLSLEPGDAFEIETPQGTVEYEVVEAG